MTITSSLAPATTAAMATTATAASLAGTGRVACGGSGVGTRLLRLVRRVWVRLRARLSVGEPEAGFGPVETALITPAVLLLVAVIAVSGHVGKATLAVDAAASSAARAASISRTASAAETAARAMAAATLTARSVACTATTVSVDTSGFSTPAGQTAVVRVDVACTMAISRLGLPGVPGSHTFTAHATSVIDSYRGRSSR